MAKVIICWPLTSVTVGLGSGLVIYDSTFCMPL